MPTDDELITQMDAALAEDDDSALVAKMDSDLGTADKGTDDDVVSEMDRFLAGAPTTEVPVEEPIMDPKKLRSSPLVPTPNESEGVQTFKAIHNESVRLRDTVDIEKLAGDGGSIEAGLQTIGAVAVGSLEWLLSNVAAFEAAAYHQVVGGMSSQQAFDRSYKDVENLFALLHEKLPESIGKYLGAPTDPEAQEMLNSFSWLIEHTVGWAGTKTGEMLSGVLDAGAEYVGKESTAGAILEGAGPWAFYLGKFGAELAAFKGIHKVGSYIGKKAGKGQLPPRTVEDFIAEKNKPPAERVPPSDLEIVRSLEQEFDKPAAAKKAAIDISRELAGESTIEAGISIREQLEVQGRRFDTTAAERGLKTAQDNYAEALRLKNDGALLETNRGVELVAQGIDPALVPNQIMSEMAASVHRAQVNLDYHKGKGVELAAEVDKATTAAREASQTGELPPNYIGDGIDPVSGSPLPFGNSLAARNAAVKHAESGTIVSVRKVPNTKNFVLEVVEQPGRRISGKKGDYTEIGAKRRQTALSNKGINTELVRTDTGYVLEVKGYSAEAAKSRLAQLRKAPEQAVRERPEPVPMRLTKEVEKSPRELYKEVEQGKAKTYITPEEKQLIVERVDYYLAQPVGSGKGLIDTIARETKTSEQAVRSTFQEMTGFDAEALLPEMTFLHAGLPITPELAKKISDAALRAGLHTSEFLQRRGYDAETAARITEAVESLAKTSKNLPTETPDNLKDTNANRQAMRRSIHQLAEAEGLETSKPTKRGKRRGEFTLEEYEAARVELGLPKDTKLQELDKMLRKERRFKHVEYLHEDRGFGEFVKDAIGKEWANDLGIKDLTTIRNRLLNTRSVPGKFIIKQNKGQPPVTDYHLRLGARLAQVERHGFAEGTVWWADRIDAKVPGFSDIFVWPMFKEWHNATKDFMRTEVVSKKLSKELKLRGEDMKNIGNYGIWQQPEGKLYLQEVKGLKAAPKLTAEQRQYYDFMRDTFEDLFQQINQARAAAGLDPIKYTENYFTFFRDLSSAAAEGVDIINSKAAAVQDYMVKARQTFFQNAKDRVVQSDLPINNNAQKVLHKYMLEAYRHIHLTPVLSYARAILDTTYNRTALVEKFGEGVWPTELVGQNKFKLSEAHPKMYEDMSQYLNYIVGITPKSNMPKFILKTATALNKNLAFSILSGAVDSALRQFGAWRLVITEAGPVNMMHAVERAAADFAKPETGSRVGKGKFDRGIRARSDQLLTRVFDATADHIYDTLNGKATTVSYVMHMRDKLGKAGLYPLKFTDEIAAVVAGHAFELKGKKLGLKGDELKKFVDQGILKTQASGTRLAVPRAMRDPLMRAVLLFQTYVLNEWTYLTREVLGYKSARPTKEKVRKAVYYVAATMAMTAAYEGIGINSPFPTPIKAFVDSQERSDPMYKSIAAAAFEVAEVVPFVGGAIRFGTALGGPILSTAADLFQSLHGDPFTPPIIVSGAKLAGVPGMNAFWKGYRTLAEDTDNNIRKRRKRRKSKKKRTRR